MELPRMANVQLNVPVLTGGILNTNFFNGRVLAAEDLTALQTANAQQRRQLGRSIGAGVACGLEVTLGSSSDPTVTVLHVTCGLALNRKGDAVALSTDVNVAITPSAQVQSATNGLFAVCTPPQTIVPTNLDCYILTISPASGLQGSAPMTSALSCGVASTCASANVVEGVQFGLLPLGISTTSNTTPLRTQALQLYATLAPQFVTLAGLSGAAATALQAQIAPNLSQFQNVMAHLCFGTDILQGFAANPFAAAANGNSLYTSYGVLDDLRAQGYLTDCAVPLALVYWTPAGVQFVDMWSVRRPVTPAGLSSSWPLLLNERRRSESVAMLLQFQDQMQSILEEVSDLTSVSADTYFAYLPTCGILPVTGDGITIVTGTPQTPGFDLEGYFGSHTSKDVATTDGDLLRHLFAAAMEYNPIPLAGTGEIQLYLIWENVQAINAGGTLQLALLFATPALDHQGVARFVPSADTAGAGTARWGLSRFARHVI
jgi:hypothetical protein